MRLYSSVFKSINLTLDQVFRPLLTSCVTLAMLFTHQCLNFLICNHRDAISTWTAVMKSKYMSEASSQFLLFLHLALAFEDPLFVYFLTNRKLSQRHFKVFLYFQKSTVGLSMLLRHSVWSDHLSFKNCMRTIHPSYPDFGAAQSIIDSGSFLTCASSRLMTLRWKAL